jgi:hypothetical protein
MRRFIISEKPRSMKERGVRAGRHDREAAVLFVTPAGANSIHGCCKKVLFVIE